MKKALLLLTMVSGWAWGGTCEITSPLPMPIIINGCIYTNPLPGGASSYIQNTLTPTTTSQNASLAQIQITSNTILSGTTIYQSGVVQMSSTVYVAGSTFSLATNGNLSIGAIVWPNGSVQVSSPTGSAGNLNWLTYRKPNLVSLSTTTVTIETGTVTTGAATIMFPDGTLRTDSTLSHIILSASMTYTVTSVANSGVVVSTCQINLWYPVFAVKSQVNNTDFVLVAGTVDYTPANYAVYNSTFGANNWVYLGLTRFGSGIGFATQGFLPFTQNGNLTIFTNQNTYAQGPTHTGLNLVATTGGCSYTWTPGVAGTSIPASLRQIIWIYDKTGATARTVSSTDGLSTSLSYLASSVLYMLQTYPATVGATIPTDNCDIVISGFYDSALNVGYTQ